MKARSPATEKKASVSKVPYTILASFVWWAGIGGAVSREFRKDQLPFHCYLILSSPLHVPSSLLAILFTRSITFATACVMMSAVNLENVSFYQPSETRRNGKNRPVFAKADIMSKAGGRALLNNAVDEMHFSTSIISLKWWT